jgi:glutathione S-transferase
MTASMTQQPKIKIYSLIAYDRGAKARWILTELGIDFETQWLDREKKEHESQDILKLNPMGRVPILEIDGQVIIESGAICAYLGDRFADHGIAPSIQSPERAAYQKWMYFAASTLDPFQTRIMIIEDIPAGDILTEKLNALQSDLRDALTTLNQTLSKKPFLVGNRFTVADVCVSYHLYWLRLWPELDALIQDSPHVIHYLERMKQMPSAVSAEVFSYNA